MAINLRRQLTDSNYTTNWKSMTQEALKNIKQVIEGLCTTSI